MLRPKWRGCRWLWALGSLMAGGCGCYELGYSASAVIGELNFLAAAVPIEEALQDPTLTDDQREKLALAIRARDYAEQVIGLNVGDRVDDERESDRGDVFKLGQEIAGIIHSRLAFSASSLVILVLAAALGVIFRGGQLLTAFVIAFVPGLLVVVMNIMGRQLTENTGTHLVGIVVIWAGIAILAATDVVVVGKYLKR